jgi:hypothetical protein
MGSSTHHHDHEASDVPPILMTRNTSSHGKLKEYVE